MVTVGLLATLDVKSGKEDDLASFLESALPLAQAEEVHPFLRRPALW